METITISRITKSLRKLPADKLIEVYDFIVFLTERGTSPNVVHEPDEPSALETMFASESVLRRDWDTPEEDEAWANL